MRLHLILKEKPIFVNLHSIVHQIYLQIVLVLVLFQVLAIHQLNLESKKQMVVPFQIYFQKNYIYHLLMLL
ncbi:MAG: hypothetical protein CMO06_18475 [Thalassospira sp.]|nr:hypothetical protein [Thalassospira sp.]